MSISSIGSKTATMPLGATSLVFGGKSNTGNYDYTGTLPAGNYVLSAVSLDNNTYSGSYYAALSNDNSKRTATNGGNVYFQLNTTESALQIRPSVVLNDSFSLISNTLFSLLQAGGRSVTANYPSAQYIPEVNLVAVRDDLGSLYKTTSTFSNWEGAGLAAFDYTYGNGKYVAVVDNYIYSSTNFLTWTQVFTNVGDAASGSYQFYGVRYVNNVFLAGGRGILYSSTDAVTWTLRFRGVPTNNINAGAYFNNQFILANSQQFFCVSTDNVTYTMYAYPASVTVQLASEYSDANEVMFGATGGNTYLRSTNGTTWTSATVPFTTTSAITKMNKLQGTYFATGSTGQMQTSTDLVTWTSRSASFGASTINTTAFGAGVYVAGGNGGRLTYSTDMTTWTATTSNFGTSTIQNIVFANNLFVAVGGGGRITSSTDGITWTGRTSGTAQTLVRVFYDGANYIAHGNTGTVTLSTDGISWSGQSSGLNNQITFMTKVGSDYHMFATSGGASGAIRSIGVGGFSTTQVAGVIGGMDNVLHSGFTYLSNGLYVISGSSPTHSLHTIMTSTDLVTYTQRIYQTGSNRGFRKIVKSSSSDLFMAGAPNGGNTNTVFTSTDGISYNSVSPNGNISSSYDFCFGNGFFVVATQLDGVNNANLAYSTDTITWTLANDSSGTNGRSVYYNGNGFLTLTSSGYPRFAAPNPNSTWLSGPFTSNANNNSSIAAFGNNVIAFSGGADGRIIYSTNGTTFIDSVVTRTDTTTSEPAKFVITFGNNLFVSANTTQALRSTNGTTWTATSVAFTGSPNAAGYSSTFGRFFIGASNSGGSIWHSTNGVAWGQTGPASTNITSFAFGPVGIATSGSTTVYYSTNATGTTWTTVTVGSVGWNFSAFGNGIFMVSAANNLSVSTNGTTWTTGTAPSAAGTASLVFANGYFYLGTITGQIWTSTNGIIWSQVYSQSGTVTDIEGLVDDIGITYGLSWTDSSNYRIVRGTNNTSIPSGYFLYRVGQGVLS